MKKMYLFLLMFLLIYPSTVAAETNESEKSDQSYQLSNGVSNSAFNTAAGWNGGGMSSLSVASNELVVSAISNSTSYFARTISTIATANAKKVYFRATIKTPDTNCTSIVLRVGGSTSPFGNYYIAKTLNSPVSNTEYTISGIATLGTPVTGNAYPTIVANCAKATGKSMKVKQVNVIDLTTILGAGNEPTAEKLDEWFTQNGWFENQATYIVGGEDATTTNGKLFSTWNGKSFMSLGDSITWQDGKMFTTGSDAGQMATGYQTILKENLGFASHVNAGVSGRPMANGTSSGAGTNTTGKAQDYSAHDLVIIAAGTNDFRLDVPLGLKGSIGDTIFDTSTFYGAYRDMIEYILTQKPSIRIVLFTPLQRDNAGYNVNYTNSADHKLIDYVNAIKEIGQMYSIPVCDMYSNSGFTKLTLKTFTRGDGLHPNNAGYARMGDYATKFINSI